LPRASKTDAGILLATVSRGAPRPPAVPRANRSGTDSRVFRLVEAANAPEVPSVAKFFSLGESRHTGGVAGAKTLARGARRERDRGKT
jgi:hypothetical protein